MTGTVISIRDGRSNCRIRSPSAGPLQATIRSIDLFGMIVNFTASIVDLEELDVMVLLDRLPPRLFYAEVIGSGKDGLRLRWMPSDSDETSRLISLLDFYRGQTDLNSKTRNRTITQYPVHSRQVLKTPRSSVGIRTGRVIRLSQKYLKRAEVISPFNEEIVDDGLGSLSLKDSIGEDRGRMSPFLGDDLKGSTGPTELVENYFGNTNSTTLAIGASGTRPEAALSRSDHDHDLIRGHDGRLDIDASIRNHVESVQTSELAARQERVRMLTMRTIRALIQGAVQDVSHKISGSSSSKEHEDLLESTIAAYKERLRSSEMEKMQSEERTQELKENLETYTVGSKDASGAQPASKRSAVAGTDLDEMEIKINRLLKNSVSEGRVMSAFEEDLRKVITVVLDQERKRIQGDGLKSHDDSIRLLENKIDRLSSTLEETERQRDEMKEWMRNVEFQNGGIRNVFVTGMKQSDPNKVLKLALMKQIIDINRSIRKELEEGSIESHEKSDGSSDHTRIEAEKASSSRTSELSIQ